MYVNAPGIRDAWRVHSCHRATLTIPTEVEAGKVRSPGPGKSGVNSRGVDDQDGTSQTRVCLPPASLRPFGALAGVAQLVEHLTCNQKVAGSIPAAGSSLPSLSNSACFRFVRAAPRTAVSRALPQSHPPRPARNSVAPCLLFGHHSYGTWAHRPLGEATSSSTWQAFEIQVGKRGYGIC
jgi:hypothetical protein